VITQKELKTYYELKRKKEAFDAINDRIKDALFKGEDIEDGPWLLNYREQSRPVVAWKEFFIRAKGQAIANRIIRRAKRTYFFVFDVIYDAIEGQKVS
jgi:hypothetical protein